MFMTITAIILFLLIMHLINSEEKFWADVQKVAKKENTTKHFTKLNK